MPFYNISNHASACWSPEQRAAAAELCGDDLVIDIPPGEVSPECDRDGVREYALNLLSWHDLVKRRDLFPGERFTPLVGGHVMVAAEATLTVAILRLLEGNNFYAATTRRESVEEVLPDGSTRETGVFKFARFREY